MKHLCSNRGSITPSFVIIVMLMMITGSYFFSLMKVYENRLIVRDAVDAAVTSALAAGAETKVRPVYYYEEQICIRSHTETDADGNSTTVCDEWDWVTRESDYQNYICIRPAEAERAAKKFLELNLKNNTKDYKVKVFNMGLAYDEGRPLAVESARYNTEVPASWWYSEFNDAEPAPLTAISTRMVRFPRWAKVNMEVTVEIKIPLGQLLGNDTMTFTWKADAVKELKEVSY